MCLTFLQGVSIGLIHLLLLRALNDWTLSLNNGFGTDVDFQKVFDTVPHYRLIKKLDAYGIKSTLLLWIKDFLNGRLHRGGGSNFTLVKQKYKQHVKHLN